MTVNRVFGLTGGIGTGKSTAAKILKKFGAKIIDADVIAHKIIQPNTLVWRELSTYFGESILKSNKEVNRSKLAEIIFKNKKARVKLNEITHPYIIKQIKYEIKRLTARRNTDIIILDAPLLFEAKITRLVDKIIVITSTQQNQIKRLMRKYGLSKESAKLRIKSQIPLSHKIKCADYVINNDGTMFDLRKNVKKLYAKV